MPDSLVDAFLQDAKLWKTPQPHSAEPIGSLYGGIAVQSL